MTTNNITAKIIPESQRINVADKHFGLRFPLTVEPFVFSMASRLSEDYGGGYWLYAFAMQHPEAGAIRGAID